MSRLINYAYFRKETDVAPQVEDSVLDNPIKWAHDQLSFQLGRQFYDDLVSQFTTGNGTFTTTEYTAFFNPYVKQFLAWAAYEDYLAKANSYETRTGVRVFKEENSDPASDGTMNMRIKKAAQKAEFYKSLMISYLIQEQARNSNTFAYFKQDYNTQNKLGTQFQISGLRKRDTSPKEIWKRTRYNTY